MKELGWVLLAVALAVGIIFGLDRWQKKTQSDCSDGCCPSLSSDMTFQKVSIHARSGSQIGTGVRYGNHVIWMANVDATGRIIGQQHIGKNLPINIPIGRAPLGEKPLGQKPSKAPNKK